MKWMRSKIALSGCSRGVRAVAVVRPSALVLGDNAARRYMTGRVEPEISQHRDGDGAAPPVTTAGRLAGSGTISALYSDFNST